MYAFRFASITLAAWALAGCNGPPSDPPAAAPAKAAPVATAASPLAGVTCVTVTPPSGGTVRDAEIRVDQPLTAYGDKNVAQVGVPRNENERRTLLWFDVSAVPAGAPVVSAKVTLGGGDASFGTIDVHLVTAPWNETAVTWSSFGSAFAPAPSTSFTDAAFSAGKTSFDVKPLVQAWVNGTPNHGMLLKKDVASPTSVATFKTREHPSDPQLEICFQGLCANVACAPLDACHVAGTCDPATGQCSHPPAPDGTACNDGNACTQVDACQAGTCTGSSPVVCTAADACHVAGACDPATGQCSNPNAPDGTACNDGNACTQVDTCQSGACAGSSPVTCAAIDACHLAGACDPATGQCSNPNAPNGTACSDGNACTSGDSCQAGACAPGTPVSCDDGNVCTTDACDPAAGCTHTAVSCDDGVACTTDSCNNPGGCQHLVACPPGAPCSNDFCASALGQTPEYAWLCQ